MKWLDWVRKQVAGSDRDAPDATGQSSVDELSESPHVDAMGAQSEAAGLDFYSAIATHQRWKNRLKAAIRGESTEVLEADAVGRSDVCALGQWLLQQERHPDIPAHLMSALQEEHAEFHRLAAEVIRLADSGQTQQALEALRTDAPYSRASHRVTKLLSQIFLQLSEFHKSGFRS